MGVTNFGDVTLEGSLSCATVYMGGNALDATEMNYLNGVAVGVRSTGKAIVVDATGRIDQFEVLTTFKIAGVAVNMTSNKLTATVIATSAAPANHVATAPTTYPTTYPAGATADGSVTLGVNAALAAVNALSDKVNSFEVIFESFGQMKTS